MESEAWSPEKGPKYPLLERGVDRSEPGVKSGAQAVHGGDNLKRNARGNEAVLNGGSPGFIRQEIQ